jgi:hypothetical protein
VASLAALRPDDDDEAATKVTRSDHPDLGIVETGVLIVEGDSLEDLRGVPKIEAAVCQGRFSLFSVEANLHRAI